MQYCQINKGSSPVDSFHSISPRDPLSLMIPHGRRHALLSFYRFLWKDFKNAGLLDNFGQSFEFWEPFQLCSRCLFHGKPCCTIRPALRNSIKTCSVPARTMEQGYLVRLQSQYRKWKKILAAKPDTLDMSFLVVSAKPTCPDICWNSLKLLHKLIYVIITYPSCDSSDSPIWCPTVSYGDRWVTCWKGWTFRSGRVGSACEWSFRRFQALKTGVQSDQTSLECKWILSLPSLT